MDVPFQSSVLETTGPFATVCVLADDEHDMDALGTHGTVVPADRALFAAAIASSAAVVVEPKSALTGEPVAAVLRYTDASTPTN